MVLTRSLNIKTHIIHRDHESHNCFQKSNPHRHTYIHIPKCLRCKGELCLCCRRIWFSQWQTAGWAFPSQNFVVALNLTSVMGTAPVLFFTACTWVESLLWSVSTVWEGWDLGRSSGSLVVLPHSNFPRVIRMISVEIDLEATGTPRHSPYSQVLVVCTLGFCSRVLWDPEFLDLPLDGMLSVSLFTLMGVMCMGR